MFVRMLFLLVAVAAATSPSTAKRTGFPVKGKGAGKLSGKTGGAASSSVVGKLRLSMLKWYCEETASHAVERPCQNYNFMQKLRSAGSPEVRKTLVQERSASMPKDDTGRKKLALQSREGYLKMYTSYCAQSSPANPTVCTNDSLKKVYDNMQKSIAASKA